MQINRQEIANAGPFFRAQPLIVHTLQCQFVTVSTKEISVPRDIPAIRGVKWKNVGIVEPQPHLT